MKRVLPILAFSLLFTSCAPEYVTEEYYEVEEGAGIHTYFYDVYPRDWVVEEASDGRKYLYAEFENLNISKSVLERGFVVAAVSYVYNAKTSAESWNNLPYVFPFTTEEEVVVGENIRFEYEYHRLTFVIEDLDGVLPEVVTDPITFKVSVVEDR